MLWRWRCWLGGMKGIRPVKNWVVGCWHGYLSAVKCIWPSWCHCHSLSLAPVKSRLVLPFWYRLTCNLMCIANIWLCENTLLPLSRLSSATGNGKQNGDCPLNAALKFHTTFWETDAFRALKQLVGWQEGHLACKKTEQWGAGAVICLERDAGLYMAQLMPLPLTVSWFSKIQIGFTFQVPAYLGSPGKKPLNGCSWSFWESVLNSDSSVYFFPENCPADNEQHAQC